MSILEGPPVIRRRQPKSQRRKDGLIQFARDVTSQNGEDGIIDKVFEILNQQEPSSISSDSTSSTRRYCVDVGAWDGCHLSNTYSLLVPSSDVDASEDGADSSSRSCSWKGVLMEADAEKCLKLQELHEPLRNIVINSTVSSEPGSKDSLAVLLQTHAPHLPVEFDFLCIDVDGQDYWLLHDIWTSYYRPKVVCIEANPTMPNDLIYIPSRNDAVRHGASLAALVELAEKNGYTLVETTIYNAFFIQTELYKTHFSSWIPDTSIEALHEMTMGTSLYQLYDGTLKVWGCKKLLWHRIAMDEEKMQMIPREKRQFPFAPPTVMPENVINVSAYCMKTKEDDVDQAVAHETKQACAKALLQVLKDDGFALVHGTGLSRDLCEDALRVTNALLQDADETVRRSTLTEDRARRGYSPMCTENFASLIGDEAPNDLVRKFRVGKEASAKAGGRSLQRPNVWPSHEDTAWNQETCQDFKSTVEAYYDAACTVADSILRAICDGLILEQPSLMESLQPIASSKKNLDHTSILTLLGYRKGSRHKQTQKKRDLRPLVAAHTDVGVITVLLYDGGDCATLQRKTRIESTNPWANIVLPSTVPHDPIFVVNIADCLSDLSGNTLPSTIHRVIPTRGITPRNCLALFVGLDPSQTLKLGETETTYEEWRKSRIARSQSVLNSYSEKDKI